MTVSKSGVETTIFSETYLLFITLSNDFDGMHTAETLGVAGTTFLWCNSLMMAAPL